MEYENARQIAEHYIRMRGDQSGTDLVLIEANTIERDFGWVFFYDSRDYLETGSISDAVAGNAPLIVARTDGSVHETGTAHPVEHYIAEFERERSRQ